MTPDQRLCELLRTIREVRVRGLPFDLDDWRRDLACGTVACLIGWGTCNPALIAEGLGTVPHPRLPEVMLPAFDGASGFAAIERLFRMTPHEVESLFTESGYRRIGDRRPVAVEEAVVALERFLIEERGVDPRLVAALDGPTGALDVPEPEERIEA